MKKFAVVVIIIIVSLISLGVVFLKTSSQKPSQEIIKHEKVRETAGKPNAKASNKATGSVIGPLCYPSSYIPAMDVYLQNTETAEYIKTQTIENEQSFKFEDIPAGKYVAFAYPQGETELGGGFTEFVKCGLSVDCEDHAMIEFTVEKNTLTTSVEICDWYGAEIPAKPLM